MGSIDDLATPARIRLAAVEAFAHKGFAHTTIRDVAAAAGVSPGLVMHHFGSKQGLREACDEWVIEALREEKVLMSLGGALPSMATWLGEHPEYVAIIDYLVAGLRAGGEVADQIWARLLAMTLEMFETGEATGTMRVPDDREAAAAWLVAASCGVMLLQQQFCRTLGGDSLHDPTITSRYGLATLAVLGQGIFTPAYVEALHTSLTTTD